MRPLRDGVSGAAAGFGRWVVLNLLKEELPEERVSRLSPFIAGAAACRALILRPGG